MEVILLLLMQLFCSAFIEFCQLDEYNVSRSICGSFFSFLYIALRNSSVLIHLLWMLCFLGFHLFSVSLSSILSAFQYSCRSCYDVLDYCDNQAHETFELLQQICNRIVLAMIADRWKYCEIEMREKKNNRKWFFRKYRNQFEWIRMRLICLIRSTGKAWTEIEMTQIPNPTNVQFGSCLCLVQ